MPSRIETLTGGLMAPDNLAPATQPKTGSGAADRAVVPGWVLMEADGRPELTVLCELDNAPDPTAGYGGWSQVPRQRAKHLSRWDGFEAVETEFDLLLDGLETDRPVNDLYDSLEGLAGRGRKSANTSVAAVEPPALRVDTAGVFRHDARSFPATRWIIVSIEWDEEEAITDEHTGERWRAACTVTLREHVQPTRLHNAALKAAMRTQAKAKKSKTYTVKDGEDLVKIARRKLGDPGRWQEIADLNKIRDPFSVRPGARIRLP